MFATRPKVLDYDSHATFASKPLFSLSLDSWSLSWLAWKLLKAISWHFMFQGKLNMKQTQIACPKVHICATLDQVTLLESIYQIENLYLSLPWYMPN